MGLYIAVVLALPLVIAAGSNSRGRVALLVTTAATWAVAVVAYARIVPDRHEAADALMFFLVYLHLITAPVAGTIATMLVPRAKSIVLPMIAALIGSVGAIALRYVFPQIADDDWTARSIDVLGPVVLSSALAVLVATLTAKRVPT